jgi:DNA-nicking Smr family endonuclease
MKEIDEVQGDEQSALPASFVPAEVPSDLHNAPRYGIVSSVTRPDEPSFKDLVKDVEPLVPSHKIVAVHPEGDGAVVVRQQARPGMHVEHHGEVIAGRANDVAEQVVHALGSLTLAHPRSIDLHRMTAARAEQTLAAGLRRARDEGERYVLVVCGKGNHSGRLGPVLAPLVVDLLAGALAEHVAAFRTAPRNLGGSGAFVVKLRGQR